MNLSLPPVIGGDLDGVINALQNYDYEARIENLLKSQEQKHLTSPCTRAIV